MVEVQFSMLEQCLYELLDVFFKVIDVFDGFEVVYELYIKQFIDYENLEKGYFYQCVYLLYCSFKVLMVLAIEGYMCFFNCMYEFIGYFDVNQVDVEY